MAHIVMVHTVMAGLDPAIHAVTLRGHSQMSTKRQRVGDRIEPAHDQADETRVKVALAA